MGTQITSNLKNGVTEEIVAICQQKRNSHKVGLKIDKGYKGRRPAPRRTCFRQRAYQMSTVYLVGQKKPKSSFLK